MSLPASASPVTFVITAHRTRSKLFYAEVLGLRVLGEDDHAVTFDRAKNQGQREGSVASATSVAQEETDGAWPLASEDLGCQASCTRCVAEGSQSQGRGDGCRQAQGPVEAMIVQGCRRKREADQQEEASPHRMRHSHASHAIAGGIPIKIAQHKLGPALPATTTVYVTTEKRRRMKAVQAFWRR